MVMRALHAMRRRRSEIVAPSSPVLAATPSNVGPGGRLPRRIYRWWRVWGDGPEWDEFISGLPLSVRTLARQALDEDRRAAGFVNRPA